MIFDDFYDTLIMIFDSMTMKTMQALIGASLARVVLALGGR